MNQYKDWQFKNLKPGDSFFTGDILRYKFSDGQWKPPYIAQYSGVIPVEHVYQKLTYEAAGYEEGTKIGDQCSSDDGRTWYDVRMACPYRSKSPYPYLMYRKVITKTNHLEQKVLDAQKSLEAAKKELEDSKSIFTINFHGCSYHCRIDDLNVHIDSMCIAKHVFKEIAKKLS